ncbi:hypothetical protein [Prescottella subtropica]|uniref:hypothetical protein n=1 Tax=Prescottella subtropica TaxID=2545757 RepID=UPI0010F65CFF|nr:hypothetical protein [Prescottella subtropica]
MPSGQISEQTDRIDDLLERTRTAGLRTASGALTPPGAALVAELWRVAFPVLLAFLRDGRILTQGPIHQPLPLTPEDLDYLEKSAPDREDLAMEMILPAIEPFLADVVDKGKWDSEQSALTTFFINRCLWNKGTVIKKWVDDRRRRQRTRVQESSEITDELDRLHHFDPDQELLHHVAFDLIGRAPANVRPILDLVAKGFTIADAADEFEISASAARTRLYRFRKDVVTPALQQEDLDLSQLPPEYALIEYLTTDRRPAA